jgi:hypothetical protein
MPSKLPRVNVTVTEEQHALLLELARLNGGSAAGYLRQMLDKATPLLRATVPALRMAAEEMNTTKEEAGTQLRKLLEAISSVGVDVPSDLFDHADDAARGPHRTREREDRARFAHQDTAK